MEQDLHIRDQVGVQDFVLLENFKSEEAFIENLQKRTKADLIYVCLFVLISAYCHTYGHQQQLNFFAYIHRPT